MPIIYYTIETKPNIPYIGVIFSSMGSLSLVCYHFDLLISLKKTATFRLLSNPALIVCSQYFTWKKSRRTMIGYSRRDIVVAYVESLQSCQGRYGVGYHRDLVVPHVQYWDAGEVLKLLRAKLRQAVVAQVQLLPQVNFLTATSGYEKVQEIQDSEGSRTLRLWQWWRRGSADSRLCRT